MHFLPGFLFIFTEISYLSITRMKRSSKRWNLQFFNQTNCVTHISVCLFSSHITYSSNEHDHSYHTAIICFNPSLQYHCREFLSLLKPIHCKKKKKKNNHVKLAWVLSNASSTSCYNKPKCKIIKPISRDVFIISSFQHSYSIYFNKTVAW